MVSVSSFDLPGVCTSGGPLNIPFAIRKGWLSIMQSTCPGLCLYTVRHAMQKDLTDTFQLLAARGLPRRRTFRPPPYARPFKTARRHAVKRAYPVSWQVPWQEAADEALPESLLSCGCRTAVVSTLFVSHTLPSRDEWFAQIDEINSLADRFARDGLRLGCHTSGFYLCTLRPARDLF